MKATKLSTKKSALKTCISKNSTPEQIYCYATKKENYKNNKLRKLHSCGNSKLPKTTFIFNFGDCHNCPSFILGLCNFRNNCNFEDVEKNTCYGLTPEIIYPNCLPYRLRQKDYWLNCTAEQFIDDFSEIYKRKKIKPTLLRFNEGCDFHSQNCVDKAEIIAKELFTLFNIKCHTYTHRTDLNFTEVVFLNVLNSTNKLVKGLTSRYIAITPQQMISVKADKFSAKFGPVKEQEKQRKIFICPGSCKKCTLCANIKIGVIYTVIH